MNGEWFWEEFRTSESGRRRWRYRDYNKFNEDNSWMFVEETPVGWMWWDNATCKHYIFDADNIEEAKALALIERRMKL